VGDNETYMQKLHSLGSNSMFIKLSLSLSGLFFVVTGIQYWLPDYMTNILNADQATVSWYYSFLSFTAPISGVIVSGVVTTKLGGYNTLKAQELTMMAAVLAVVSALPIPFISQIHSFALFIWLLLFFGGAILPNITGIMLNSVSEYQRTSANSLANLAYNLFGYAPAPLFYGVISKIAGGDKSRVPMASLLYSTICTVTLFLSAMRQKFELQKQQNQAAELVDELILETSKSSKMAQDF
jgi:MFS transporter, Spinster family, sphingosine-1-phosphate transporter